MSTTSTVSFALLNRCCSLVVLLTFVHISVTVVFYVRSMDLSTSFLPILKKVNQTGVTIQNRPPEEEQGFVLMPCPSTSPHLLGPLSVEFGMAVTLEQVEKKNPEVIEGGWSPSNCVSVQRVAILIPFRHRDEHLKLWLHYMHPILQRQQLDYSVYIINQGRAGRLIGSAVHQHHPHHHLHQMRCHIGGEHKAGEGKFNRAKLLNVGFMEAIKDYDYNCFVFSDVDIVPLDDRNTYGCFEQPRHLSVAMDKFGFKLPYNNYFGGVSSLSKTQFLMINGFPNNYWGWGGEDDDIFKRCIFKGMTITRPSGAIGRCRMIRHQRDAKNEPNPKRMKQLGNTKETMKADGIKSLKYKLIKITKFPLYTNITVDVGHP